MSQITSFQPNYSSYAWKVYDLGRISYGKALELQKQYRKTVKDGGDHVLLLLEHDPVITLGRRTEPDHLLKTADELKSDGIELFEVDRGGSATYHGPGQLVGYVICKSSRVGGIHELVSRVLKAVSNTISSFGIDCYVDEENPGIWSKGEVSRKLAAVGMSNTHGYTMHGFAINVDLPLTGFAAIVPCGLTLPVSTMAIESGRRIAVDEVKQKAIEELNKVLKLPVEGL